MTVADVIQLFPDSSDVQFNILKPDGGLVYIPDAAFYRSNLRLTCSTDNLRVYSIDMEVERVGDDILKLCVIDARGSES